MRPLSDRTLQHPLTMSSSNGPHSDLVTAGNRVEDPLVRAARREALVAVGMWLVAMCYSVTYCYWEGYGRSVEKLYFVLWFPDWVFWGIVVPWLVATLASIIFAFRVMGNQPLGEDVEADPAAPAPHEAFN